MTRPVALIEGLRKGAGGEAKYGVDPHNRMGDREEV